MSNLEIIPLGLGLTAQRTHAEDIGSSFYQNLIGPNWAGVIRIHIVSKLGRTARNARLCCSVRLSEFGSGTKSQSEFSNRAETISLLLGCSVWFTWNKLTALWGTICRILYCPTST